MMGGELKITSTSEGTLIEIIIPDKITESLPLKDCSDVYPFCAKKEEL